MNPQTRRDIASLAQAARDILAFVRDPGERPEPYSVMDQSVSSYPRRPKSPMEDAREKADQLEKQSQAVRRLKRELENWVDWKVEA